jgi:hypothetical protein
MQLQLIRNWAARLNFGEAHRTAYGIDNPEAGDPSPFQVRRPWLTTEGSKSKWLGNDVHGLLV